MNWRRSCLALPVWLLPAFLALGANLAPAPTIPLEEIHPQRRDLVRGVLEKPTLYARGPAESFFCKPDFYFYFLDHPDKAVVAWRRLGAKCVSITPRGPQLFGWTDENGSEVNWETVLRSPSQRIWWAEGKVKPGPLLPAVPVKAVVVLNHSEGQSTKGGKMVFHQSDIYIHTDSKSAALVTKLVGNQANKVAEQGLGQLQLFFSGLSWYLDRHPEQAASLLKE